MTRCTHISSYTVTQKSNLVPFSFCNSNLNLLLPDVFVNYSIFQKIFQGNYCSRSRAPSLRRFDEGRAEIHNSNNGGTMDPDEPIDRVSAGRTEFWRLEFPNTEEPGEGFDRGNEVRVAGRTSSCTQEVQAKTWTELQFLQILDYFKCNDLFCFSIWMIYYIAIRKVKNISHWGKGYLDVEEKYSFQIFDLKIFNNYSCVKIKILDELFFFFF